MQSTAAAAVAIVIIVKCRKIKNSERKRSTWVKDWLNRRTELGVSTNFFYCACIYYVMTLLRMWHGEKIRVARINSLRGYPPLGTNFKVNRML